MKTKLIFTCAVLLCISALPSCNKDESTLTTQCNHCNQINSPKDTAIQLMLRYPYAANRGASVTIVAILNRPNTGSLSVKWYSDDYPFPQTLRRIDTLLSETKTIYQFTFPTINGSYFVRCVISMSDGFTAAEETIRIVVNQ